MLGTGILVYFLNRFRKIKFRNRVQWKIQSLPVNSKVLRLTGGNLAAFLIALIALQDTIINYRIIVELKKLKNKDVLPVSTPGLNISSFADLLALPGAKVNVKMS